MSVERATQAVDAGSQDGAQESRPYEADVARGWVERDGGVRILSILMAIGCTGERGERFFRLAGRNKF